MPGFEGLNQTDIAGLLRTAWSRSSTMKHILQTQPAGLYIGEGSMDLIAAIGMIITICQKKGLNKDEVHVLNHVGKVACTIFLGSHELKA